MSAVEATPAQWRPPCAPGPLGGAVRHVLRLPLVRRLRSRPAVNHLIDDIKAALVFAQPGRFAARELCARVLTRIGRPPTGVAAYTLRDSALAAHIRHGTVDSEVLKEIFVSKHYELPEDVAAALAGLESPLRVADLGGHAGFFGLFALSRLPSAEVTSFEPDVFNLGVLRRTVQANTATSRWQIVEACASDRSGVVPFIGGESWVSRVADAEARSHDGPAPQPTPAEDVFPYLREIDLLKIDIEGGEWPILADARFWQLPARAIALEYHRFSCPGPEPRELAARALQDAGYAVRDIIPSSNGIGMLWGWRDRHGRVGEC